MHSLYRHSYTLYVSEYNLMYICVCVNHTGQQTDNSQVDSLKHTNHTSFSHYLRPSTHQEEAEETSPLTHTRRKLAPVIQQHPAGIRVRCLPLTAPLLAALIVPNTCNFLCYITRSGATGLTPSLSYDTNTP